MNRTVLLEGPEVSLEDRALTVSGFRYVLSEIKSVEILRVPKAATGPILMIASGIVCVLAVGGDVGLEGALVGIGLIAGAVAWWTQKKPSFHVSLSTKDGQVVPFESQDEQAAHSVLNAINDARASAGD
jgi:hypothetical protein